MKILLISYHYPPDRAVGGQRAKKVVDSLRAAGHDVVVVAAGEPTNDLHISRVKPLPSVRDIYAAFRHRSRTMEDPAESRSGSSSSATREVPFWKRWIFSLIWLPDDRQGFIMPAIRRGLRVLDRQPHLIYTTAPPFSVHLAGLMLRVLTGAPWVAEFRDPWTANPWKPAHMRSTFSEWLERKLEWLCLETADLLVPVSEGIAERLTERGIYSPIRVIRNGIEDLLSEDAATAKLRERGPFEIVYAGSLYHTRDPFPFLDAVKQVVAARSLEPKDLHVRFIGMEAFDGRSIGDYVRKTGLDQYVLLEGWMEPERCQLCVRSSDALLLLALDQPDQVPNKVYEYLGARRPILAVADEDGETARMLKQVGGHQVVSSNNAERIRHALDALLNQDRRGPVGDPGVLEKWTTAAQMAELPGAVEWCVDRASANSAYSSP